jgi:lipopolysaccharide transport system permease protein
VPYPVFVFAGLLPWLFFANGLTQAGLSLINQQYILQKIYLPRILLPTAAVGVFLVDMLASFGLYAVVLALYSYAPRWTVVFAPLLLLLVILLTLGLSYIFSALTVLYRDIRMLIPFFVQILMYVSPVLYPSRMLPRRVQPLLALNPLVGIIEGFRSAILGTPWNVPALVSSVVITLMIFVFGLFYFHKIERRFADVA